MIKIIHETVTGDKEINIGSNTIAISIEPNFDCDDAFSFGINTEPNVKSLPGDAARNFGGYTNAKREHGFEYLKAGTIKFKFDRTGTKQTVLVTRTVFSCE